MAGKGSSATHVQLTLHRKIGGEKECVCGSEMVPEKGRTGWACLHQRATGEPTTIRVPRGKINVEKLLEAAQRSE